MMKITSSTSITSTSGVVLISLMGGGPELASSGSGAKAMSEVDMDAADEAVQVRENDAVASHARIVREHRRNSDDEARGSHDQRLAHLIGDLLQLHLSRAGQPDQRVVDPPNRS